MISVTGFPALLLLLLISLVWVIPYWRLLPQYGYSKWLSLACLVPILGGLAAVILLWVLAFSSRPTKVLTEVFE